MKYGDVKSIYECEWKEERKQYENMRTKKFPLILKPQSTDEEILASVVSGGLFGYLVVDIMTPEHLIESLSNFPPIIRRLEVTKDYLSEYMADRYAQKNPNGPELKRETVVQCFSAESHLLMTPLIRFYLKIGLKITKIHRVIQYQPHRALSPFVKHVTSMRIDGEKAGNKTKANSAKTFGNAGYGKVISFLSIN